MPQTKTKTRIIRFSGILILVLILSTILTFLFQSQNHLVTYIIAGKADLVTVSYLRLLVHIQPEDTELRLELASKLNEIGRWDEAHETLHPVLTQDGRIYWPARLLLIEIEKNKLYSLAETDSQRQVVLRDMGDQLALLTAKEIPDAYLENIAKLCLELARPDIAADFYTRLAATDPIRRAEWLALAGKWRLASNSPMRAALAYNEAFTATNDPEAAVGYAIQALDAFRAANDMTVALSLASTYLARFPENRKLLDRAIDIARAQEKQEQALEWGFLRLALDPADEGQLERQLNLALEAGKLSTALKLAQQLIQVKPENSAARQRLAEIAEWSGNPAQALTQWRWLAREAPESQAPAHALDLARGLGDDPARIELLALISHQRRLEDAEIKEVVEAFRRTGGLYAGSEFLRDYVTRHPKHFNAWTALAQLQEQDDKLRAAEATWRRIGANFGRPIDVACSRSELLWQLDLREDAFRLLTDVQPVATDDKTAYWKLLGEQGWNLDHKMPALIAYRILWRTGNADVLVAERLVLLARDTDHPDEAIAVAEAAFKRFDETRFLLLAMDVAIAADSWGEVARLMKIARNEQKHLQDKEMYWLQEAMLSVQEGQHEDAQAHYQRALQLNPESIPARVGLLWVLIEANDTRQLPRYLTRWESEAVNEPAFWGAYAIALTKLGFTKKALPWFQRQAKANPQDSALLLSYSQTLEAAGKTDAAWRLRRHVLRQLRPMIQPDTLTKVNP